MKTKENATILTGNSRAELERKIVNHFSLGCRPITEVKETENSKFQIELKN
jgi:hypothetical protein